MTLATAIILAAILFGVVSLAVSVFCFKKSRHHRGMLEFLAKQNEDLEENLAASRELIEKNAKRSADQSRRIAWLETRVRQPKHDEDEVLDDTILAPSAPKSNITERRHRVLSLASRGQSSENIASTLGMMRGEVELIINLSRVTA